MKILLLNQVFYPDVVSTAQHLSDLAADLAARGHEVTVIAGRRAYDEPEKLFPARETWRGVKIFRVASTRFGKKAKWRRAVDFASFIFFGCGRLFFLPRQDVVVALTTPPLIPFIGAWRAKLWRAKFFYWVMDLNPDEAIAAGWLRKDSAVAKILERMSRFSLRSAKKIIALDRFMRDRIIAKGIAPEKISIIPPWTQDDEIKFDAAGRGTFRRTQGVENKFMVMYAGNHGPVHPLETLMAAAERLQGDESFAFCFVGGGSEFEKTKILQGRAEREDWKLKIVCLPYRPLNELAAALSAADAQVVVMGDAMIGLVHPCKIYNILAVGAPVVYIGPVPSHVTEILAGAATGISVRHGEAEKLAAQLKNLAGAKCPARAPKLDEKFSRATLLTRLIAVLENASAT